MVIRRQTLSHDDLVHPEYTHQTSPRKWTTHQSAMNITTDYRGTGYRPSWLYQSSHGTGNITAAEKPYADWIGKKIIYWSGESIGAIGPTFTARIRPDPGEYQRSAILQWNSTEGMSNGPAATYIHEYEIARHLRPNIYRLVFVDDAGNWRTKVDMDYRAGRVNILISPSDTIVGVTFS